MNQAHNEDASILSEGGVRKLGKPQKRSTVAVNLNQTQIVGLGGMSGGKVNKGSESEIASGGKKRKSTGGPVMVAGSKKALNLTGTIPKDVLSPNIMPQPKFTIATQNSY